MQVKGILLAIVTLLPGCASMQDYHYEKTNAMRSHFAWYRAAPNVRQGLWPSDYGQGWRMGYFAVTMGGGSHPPTFPPTQYWSAQYQSPAGQAEIAAWYRGYQDGAMRAERRGAGSFHYLHAHDDGSHGAGQVIQSAPTTPEVEPESVPAGNTSIRHSESVGLKPVRAGDALRTADARARVRQAEARTSGARPDVQENASSPNQAIELPALMPSGTFAAPPPVMLLQPTSMQPVEGDFAAGSETPTTTGIEKSSWTTATNDSAEPRSPGLRGWVTRLPPVRSPLFNPPAPAASTDKP